MEHAIKTIQEELRERLQQFKEEGKLLEAQRLEMRVNYDLEMLETMAFAAASRTIPGIWTRELESPRTRSSTISRTISCASSTRAM